MASGSNKHHLNRCSHYTPVRSKCFTNIKTCPTDGDSDSETDSCHNRCTSSSETSFNTVIFCGPSVSEQQQQQQQQQHDEHQNQHLNECNQNNSLRIANLCVDGVQDCGHRCDGKGQSSRQTREMKKAHHQKLSRSTKTIKPSCHTTKATREVGEVKKEGNKSFMDVATSPRCRRSVPNSPKSDELWVDAPKRSLRKRRTPDPGVELWVDGPNLAISSPKHCQSSACVHGEKQQRISEWLHQQQLKVSSLKERCFNKSIACDGVNVEELTSQSAAHFKALSLADDAIAYISSKTNEKACQTDAPSHCASTTSDTATDPVSCLQNEMSSRYCERSERSATSVDGDCVLREDQRCNQPFFTPNSSLKCACGNDGRCLLDSSNLDNSFSKPLSSIWSCNPDAEEDLEKSDKDAVVKTAEPPGQLKLEQFLKKLTAITNPIPSQNDQNLDNSSMVKCYDLSGHELRQFQNDITLSAKFTASTLFKGSCNPCTKDPPKPRGSTDPDQTKNDFQNSDPLIDRLMELPHGKVEKSGLNFTPHAEVSEVSFVLETQDSSYGQNETAEIGPRKIAASSPAGRYAGNRNDSQPPSSGYDSAIMDESDEEKRTIESRKSNYVPVDRVKIKLRNKSKKNGKSKTDSEKRNSTDSEKCSFLCCKFMNSIY